ncbi:MAG: hypothetical protein C5B54_08065, partial [Acidobacteria bacterium]
MRFISVLSFSLLLSACVPVFASQGDLQLALLSQAKDLNPKVLDYALYAAGVAAKRGEVSNKNILTVIDFSLPSTQKRLWTFDLTNRSLLFHEWVAHGKDSGENMTVHFSNDLSTVMSSVGLYRTDVTYFGKNGYSLRLVGLDKGFNDTVYDRAVVLHGAWYVSQKMIDEFGRLGRSWGCPAV